jgi:hypothetical protein
MSLHVNITVNHGDKEEATQKKKHPGRGALKKLEGDELSYSSVSSIQSFSQLAFQVVGFIFMNYTTFCQFIDH